MSLLWVFDLRRLLNVEAEVVAGTVELRFELERFGAGL